MRRVARRVASRPVPPRQVLACGRAPREARRVAPPEVPGEAALNYLQLGRRAEELLAAPLDEPQRPLRMCLRRTEAHHVLADADARWLIAARSEATQDLLDARAVYRVWRSALDAEPLRRAAAPQGGDFEHVRLMGSLELAPEPRIETRTRQGLAAPIAAALERLLSLSVPPRGRENHVLDGRGWGWSVEGGARRVGIEWRESGPSGWQDLATVHRQLWELLSAA